jgi:hypothetical protein
MKKVRENARLPAVMVGKLARQSARRCRAGTGDLRGADDLPTLTDADECSVRPRVRHAVSPRFRCNLFIRDGVVTGVRMDMLGSDFDEFVRDCSPGLLRMAYLLTGDRGHAEDVVRAALLRVARRWRRIRGEPAPYARRAVVNLAAAPEM